MFKKVPFSPFLLTLQQFFKKGPRSVEKLETERCLKKVLKERETGDDTSISLSKSQQRL